MIVSIFLFALLSMNPFLAYASTVPAPAATAEEEPKPGTLIVITFENGTTKVVRSSSTNVLPVTGGYLVVDPSVVPSQPLPAKTISKTVINQFYTAIAIAIGITITEPPPIQGPSDCLPGTIFDPVNKQCDPEAGECPEGEIRGRSGYCAVLPKECPSGTSIDEDPICEPGFNQDCPLGTTLKADKTGCEPIECSDGEILQGDDCVPEFATTPVTPTEPPAGEVLQEEPVPEPDPELAPDPGNEEEQNEGEESENENGDSDSGDGDGGGSEGDGGEGGESG